MSRFLRWVAATALSAPLLVHAQELGLKLRPQQELLTRSVDDSDADTPMFVEADALSGTQGQCFDATGAVKLRQRGRVVFADQIQYCVADEQMSAAGNVRLDRRGDVIETDKLFFDLRNEKGNADSSEYFFRAFKARGKAEKLFIDSKTQYRVEKGTYSTCAAPEDQWFIRVGKIRLDRAADKGVARDATIVVKGWPVLYTPYLSFPLSDARKSGFLNPTFGTSNNSGFEFATPYYFNLAPNYDWTLTPRILAERGIQLNNQVRYLGTTYNGLLNAEYLYQDRKLNDETRYSIAYQHNQAFSPRLNGYLNLQKVSDDQYFVDLSNRIAVTSLRNLPRDAALNYSGGWYTAGVRAQSFQTLQDPLAPITPAYARLPQLTLAAQRANVNGFDLDVRSEYVNFTQPTLVTGQRFILYPSVTYPLQTSFVRIVPKLGLSYTGYALNDANNTTGFSNANRTLPIFSLDSTVTFERSTTLFRQAFLQTLEPRLYYVYIPFKDQNQLPVFDTAEADVNYAQLFSENQFSGGDRINNANQITAAVSSRLISPDDGQERFRFTLGERFYFSTQQVTLPGVAPRTSNRSDLLAIVNGRLTNSWYLDAGLNQDVSAKQVDRSTLILRYNPEPGRVINTGYRYNNNDTGSGYQQFDLSGQWPIGDSWSAVGRYAYSLQSRSAVATILGVEYNASCWAARFVVQEFVAATNNTVRALFFQIELGGLSRLGSNPQEILRQNIAGYQRMSTIPQGGAQSDYYPEQ
jgi:LPS-assembly protein